MFTESSKAVYSRDLLLNFLFTRIFKSFGLMRSCIIIFLSSISLCYLAGLIDGTLFSSPNLLGVINDYPLYVLWPSMLGISAVFYKFSRVLETFLDKDLEEILNSKKVSPEMVKLHDQYISKVLAPSGRYKVIQLIVLTVFIAFWFLNLLNAFDPVRYYGKDLWHSIYHPFGFAIGKLLNLIYFTFFSALFYKYVSGLAVITFLFIKISKVDGFNIRPLSPDNCSGLKILSDLSLYFVYMVLPTFLFFIAKFFVSKRLLPTQEIILASLIAVLFVSFFLPLGAVHGAMKRAKHRELDGIDINFREINDEVKALLGKKNYQHELAVKLDILQKMDFLYNNVRKMPVWPFNLGNLGRVLAASFIPVAMFLIDSLSDSGSFIYKLFRLLGDKGT